MANLQNLAPELLDRILLDCDPIDIASFAQTARFAREQVYGEHNETHLWHLIFLNLFDAPILPPHRGPAMGRAGEIEGEDPKSNQLPTISNWRAIVQERVRLRQTLTSAVDETFNSRFLKNYPNERILEVYRIIFDLLDTSKPDTKPPGRTDSLNLHFLNNLLANPLAQFRIIHYSGMNFQHVPLFQFRETHSNPFVAAAAELHSKYGLTSLDHTRARTRGIARESCYALANYHQKNLYGPFMPDYSCRVNWPHLEALSIVVGLNLSLARRRAGGQESSDQPSSSLNLSPPPTHIALRQPQVSATGGANEPDTVSGAQWNIPWPILDGLPAARPHTQLMHPAYDHPVYPWPDPARKPDDPVRLNLNHYDWAGVEGKWLRVVCFLDYRDLHTYNFSPSNPRPRLDDHTEALRCMTLDLKVVSIGERPSDDPSHPVPPCLQSGPKDRPPIYFRGTSAALTSPAVGHPTAQVRGCVSSTKDGQVRWSVVSTAGGHDRWSSEGIQVGGPRSRWGILGAWTDVNRADVEGPAGPFYFFKRSC